MFDSLDAPYIDEIQSTPRPLTVHEALARAHRERSRTAHGFLAAIRRALF